MSRLLTNPERMGGSLLLAPPGIRLQSWRARFKPVRPCRWLAGVAFCAGAFFVLACFAQTAFAQPDLRVAADTSLLQNPLSGYRFETLGPLASQGASRYRIYLALPQKPPPPEGYPVFYLLDGNAALDTLASQTGALEKCAAAANPPALVMIGYETASRFDVVARAYDYTPPIPGEPDLTDRPGSGRKAGGAEIFRDFLIHTLKPELQRKFRVDPRRQTLWGHSYGGLFTLYVLFTHPGDFQRYVAVSPSLWWREGWIFQVEEAAARAIQEPVTLLALSGTDEVGARARLDQGKDAPSDIQARPPPALPADSLRRLITRLDARNNVNANLLLFDNKTHGEMFAIGLETLLRETDAPAPATP
jgi:predicted alpha/beta superfamily hydrolase